MDRSKFTQFMDHFNKHAGIERPVVLLFDSVSSHVDHDVLMKAKAQGIELYRFVPKATYLIQPYPSFGQRCVWATKVQMAHDRKEIHT